MKRIACFGILFLAVIVSTTEAKQLRKFYLTRDAFTGARALTACANGYHMASLWEILDVTNLKYDANRGLIQDDSGSGPPTVLGWIRTGAGSTGNTGAPGFDNCLAWTSDSASDNGTAAGPKLFWNAPPGSTDPWISFTFICKSPQPVWCVQD
jgi:hypothetical protein